MTDQSPAEQLASEIRTLQNTFNELQSGIRLSDLRDEAGDLDTIVNGLAQSVRDLRAGGYVFEKSLEEKAASLARGWSTLNLSVQQQIGQQAIWLQMEFRPVENIMVQLISNESNLYVAQPLLAQAKAAMSTFQSKVNGAVDAIRNMYSQFRQEVDKFTAHEREIQWMLAQLAEASFQLSPQEAGVASVKATWIQGDKESKEDPKGVLFITDQRLLFEQKQEVATKKVLFITTQKQKVQKLLLTANWDEVKGATGSKQGLFGHEDHLLVTMTRQPWHFHLDGQDCMLWQGSLGRARVRDFDRERVVPPQGEAVPTPVIPEKCPSCGGAITQAATRGMTTVTCAFCGRVIRL